MKKKNAKKKSPRLSLSKALFKGGYIHNPVLTQIIGICPIVAAATTFKNALIISAVLSVMLIVCEVISSAFLKSVPKWFRVLIDTLISCAVLLCGVRPLSAETLTQLGIYLPLLCVNGLLVIRCEKFAVRTTVFNSLLDAVASALGFSVVAVIVGSIRELLITGTVFGIHLSHFKPLSAMALPFGGLLVLGFLAALHRWSVLKFFPGELVETFNLSKAFEKPVLKDPGLRVREEQKEKRRSASLVREYNEEIRPRYSIEDIGEDGDGE